MFGCLFRIIQGFIVLALAGALAYFGVPWVEGEFAKTDRLPTVTKKTVANASVGDPFLVSGKVSKKNKVHENGLVLGRREIEEESTIRENDKVRHVKVWRTEHGFGDRILIFTHAGLAKITWDGIGDVEFDGKDVDVRKGDKRWIGVKVGSDVTNYATLSSKKPLTFAGSKSVFIGTAAQYKASSKESGKEVVWTVYIIAAFIGVIGACLIVSAPFRRKSS